MKPKTHIAFTLCFLFSLTAVIFSSGCTEKQDENMRMYMSEFQTMGKLTAKVSVYSSEEELNRAFKICKTEFDAVNALCSVFDRDSELSRLNRYAADKPFVCSEDMWFLLMRSKKAYHETGGAFDITIKPLMDLWGFYGKHGNDRPSESEIAATMEMVGFDKLVFNEYNRTVFFSVPGMKLDMGGIAKGYAVDRAFRALCKAGISAGVIDLAGNLRTLKSAPKGKQHYLVAIRDPRSPEKTLDEILTVAPGMAVSTSGNYERFVTYKNKKYSHIISPATGDPSEITAATVVASSAMDADIFSTACCMGGGNMADRLRSLYPEILIYFTR